MGVTQSETPPPPHTHTPYPPHPPLSCTHTQELVELPSLDAFNISDEKSVLKVKLALAQTEIIKLKATLHAVANPQGLSIQILKPYILNSKP